MSRPVFFQHLRKTAGTSLADTLRLFFRPERISNVANDFVAGMSIDDALASLSRYDLVMGHEEILSSSPRDSFRTAIFRNPMTRLLSERRQWMQAGPENLDAAPADAASATRSLQRQSLIEVLGAVEHHPVLLSSFWNHQALTLGGWPLLRAAARDRSATAYKFSRLYTHFDSGRVLQAWLEDNRGPILAGALAALKSLDYVGITEDFDASVQEIFARIGLPEPGQVVVRNARSAFSDEGDPRLEEVAQAFLELDRELYEAAVERHAVAGRVARGTPLDYISREVTLGRPTTISSRDAPGGHGWYPPHRRGDGQWARWSGPDLESRLCVTTPPGRYRLEVEVFGAVNGRTLMEIEILVEGCPLLVEPPHEAEGRWRFATAFSRDRRGSFDIVFRVPDIGLPYGFELNQAIVTPF